MKIIVVSDLWFPDTFGGSERVAQETATGLSRRGHELEVWTLRARASLPDRSFDGDVRINRVGWTRLHRVVPRTLTMIAVGLRASKAARGSDLIITHDPWTSFGLWLSATRIPILKQFHASDYLEWKQAGPDASRRLGKRLRRLQPTAFAAYARLLKFAERRGVRKAAAITLLSSYSFGILERMHGAPRVPVAVIPGGVDTERFSPARDRQALRARLGFGDDERIVLTVRRLDPRMGIPQLLDAVADLEGRGVRLRAIVAGDGPLREQIRQQVLDRDLSGSVELRGKVSEDELVDLYRAADLFVLPTQAYEGFGMVTLEALACGTPVLGTPIGATPEILAPLEPRLVMRGADVASIATGIVDVLEMDATSLRERSRLHATGYSWDRIITQFEQFAGRTAARRFQRSEEHA